MRPGGDFGTLGCKEHFATPLYGLHYLQRLWKETRESWTLTIVQLSRLQQPWSGNSTWALARRQYTKLYPRLSPQARCICGASLKSIMGGNEGRLVPEGLDQVVESQT